LALVGVILLVEYPGMNPSRFVFAIVAGCCLLCPASLPAEEGTPPFAMEKQYSAEMTITTKAGMTLQLKSYVDGDKMRSEMTMNGMDMATIVRKDKQKIYQVMVSQKMVMELPYDPDKFKGSTAASFGPEGKFELVGPDIVDGVACMKYKVTSDKNKQIFYFWLDAARKAPVEMAAEDGSFTAKWKNFKTGPQDASLFELPAGYQVMAMPAMPGGAGGGGQ
jgi:outer membrane lipoprotein-sorting protein